MTLKSIDSDHTIAAKYLKSDESATNYYVRNIYTMLDGSIKKTETLYQTSELPSDTVYIDPVMPGTGSNDPLYLLLGDLVNCFDFASHKIYDYSNKDNPIELPSDAGGSHPVGTQYYFNGADGDRLVEFYFEQNLGNDEYRLKTECDYPISFYKGATQIYSAKVGETFTIKAENTLDNGNTFKYWIGQNTNMEKVTFTDAKSNETTVTITSPGDVYFTAVYGPESATVTRLTERTVLDDNISAMEAFRLGSINTVGATVPDFRIENGVSYVLTKIALESSDGIFKEEYSTDKLEFMGQNLGLYNMFADNTLIPNGYPEMTYTLYYKNAISINQQDAMKKALNFEPVDNDFNETVTEVNPIIDYKIATSSESNLVKSSGIEYAATKYFDIRMVATDNNGNKANVTDFKGDISVSVTLSDAELEKIAGKEGVSLVRIHNGEAEVLEAKLNNNTLTFESKAFSTYALVYKRNLNLTFGLEDGVPELKYTLRGLGDVVSDNLIELVFDGVSVLFDRETDGSYTCPKGYLDNRVFVSTYDVDIKVKGSLIYTLKNVGAGSYKENKIVTSYDAVNNEIVMDFSGFGAERDEMMNLFLNPDAEPEINRSVYINGARIDNSVKKGNDTALYKSDDNTIRIKNWVLDMVKNIDAESNSGFVGIEGYSNVVIERYTFNSNPAPEGFSAKVFQDKNNIYLDINCVTKENRDKLMLLRNVGTAFTYQYGVGVDALTIKDLQTMNAVSYPDDKTLRIQLNTEGGVNGYAGYEVVLEGMFGTVVQTEAKFAIAPVAANISSSMTSLSQVSLERGWPRETFQGFEQEGHKWQWVDGSQELKTGTYKARIEVWDYKGSSYLRDANHYVDYNEACKNADNVSYVVENGHHYLEAEIKVVKPEAADDHETSIINFDPNNDKSYLAEANRSDVNRIDTVSSNNSLTTVDYYDIKLDGGTVRSIENEGSFTVVLPDWVDDEPVADDMEREYSVVTYHDGTAKFLPATVNSDGTLTFKSKEFSVFTIVYKDKVKVNEGGTNSNPIIIKKPAVNTSAK